MSSFFTRWREAFSRVVPEGDAIMTRWPEAFSRVVPEGDAFAYDFRVRVGAVLLHS